MRTTHAAGDGGTLQRSVAACLASILEVDLADVPQPPEDHPQPWTVWRNWLGQRGLGLAPVAEPAVFSWPGPWLAILDTGFGELGAVAFGVPPGIAWTPAGDTASFDSIIAGYLLAPADVALWTPNPRNAERTSGIVESMAVAQDAGGPMVEVQSAQVKAGRGLKGDRYFDDRGTFSNVHGRGYDLTLIEAEVIEQLVLPEGQLTALEARRNLVTRGIDLNALVGRHFMIGTVRCFGQRLCEPCAHLERLTAQIGKPGTLRALIHKGGLRADILDDGEIRRGDTITPA